MCMCVREREKKRERNSSSYILDQSQRLHNYTLSPLLDLTNLIFPTIVKVWRVKQEAFSFEILSGSNQHFRRGRGLYLDESIKSP